MRRLWIAGLAILASTGCNLEVFNPGAITDESLNDPTLMGVVANGVANEFNQIVEDFAFDNARLTDEIAGSGSYFQTGRLRRGAMDWDETDNMWAQIHETIWTGLSAWDRMGKVDGYDRSTSADAARVWLLIGHAHRMFGENFCQVVYSVGPSPEEPVLGGVLPRTASFDSAIAAFNQAITIGTAAGETDIVTAARAGLAQAYAGLGDFATATTHSTQVATDFEVEAIYNTSSNQNIVFNETWDRAETSMYATYAAGLATQDPRAEYTICGTFDDPADPKNSDVTSTNLCTAHQGADGVTAHYRQEKYQTEGADIPYAKGTEMRLIEAEAALLGNDLITFRDRINEVRNFYGLGDLTGGVLGVPGSAGALEYPINYDANSGDVSGTDAWSILDAERQLTLYIEGRRLWDLHRWNHPFLDGGIVFWDTEARRVSCWPVPEEECTLNETLSASNASLLTGVGAATQTCS